MTRKKAADVLVKIDSAIIILFLVAVIRLKWYEELFEKDR